MRAAVLAFGSTGDVLPCLAVAIRLKERNPGTAVWFLTHSAHEALIKEPAECVGLVLRFAASPPARVWNGGGSSEQRAGDLKRKHPSSDAGSTETGSTAPPAGDRSLFDAELLQSQGEACISVCEEATGRRLPQQPACPLRQHARQLQCAHVNNLQAGSVEEDQHEDMTTMIQAAAGTACVICFNLFAQEGYHIAQALHVPCVALSPCLPPTALPAALERSLQRGHPKLYSRLKQQEENHREAARGEQGVGTAAEADEGRLLPVSWAEVRHWLWPAFTERWGPWRHHRLGLPAVPYATCADDLEDLPPAPPLVYGLSELLVQRPGHWPASVHLCGFFHSSACFPAAQLALPPTLQELLHTEEPAAMAAVAGPELAAPQSPGLQQPQHQAASGPFLARSNQVVCVDFGSMGRMGLIPQPSLLIAILAVTAWAVHRPVVLLTGGWQPLLDAWAAWQHEQQHTHDEEGPMQRETRRQPPGRLIVLEQPVSHDVLLPRCAALVHHGGMGTVGAALRHGTPQLICPLHFDQQQNAERVCWGGWGARLATSLIRPPQPPDGAGADGHRDSSAALGEEGGTQLATALTQLLGSPAVRAACQQARVRLAEEDGVGAAAAVIEQHVAAAARGHSRPGASALHGRPAAAAAHPEAACQPAPSLEGGCTEQQAPRLRMERQQQDLKLPNRLAIACLSRSEALFIYREVWEQRCYARHGIRLPPGALVVDAGANIGVFTLWTLLQWQPAAAHVWAFEPLPPLAAVLERNLLRHGLDRKVTVVHAGLHAQPGTMAFTFYPHMPGNSTAKPREKWQHQLPLMAAGLANADAAQAFFQEAAVVMRPVTALGQFLHRQQQVQDEQRRSQQQAQGEQTSQALPTPAALQTRAHWEEDADGQPAPCQQKLDVTERSDGQSFVVDLLKVDCEGCELEVLQGLDAASWPLVRQVVAEVHCVGDRVQAVCGLLEAQGYAVVTEQQADVPGAVMVYARRP